MTVSATKQYELTFNTTGGDLDAKQTFFQGLYLWSPHIFDLRLRRKTVEVPLSDIAAFKGDGKRRPWRLTLYGLIYDNTQAIAVLGNMHRVQAYLSMYSDYYLKARIYFTSGPDYQDLVLYGKMESAIASPAKGSQYTVFQPRIQWASHDPFWYDGEDWTENTVIMTTGNLAYCSCANNPHFDQQRWTSKIEVNIDTKVIKNPKVESFYDSSLWYQITGELSDIGDYWLVDHLNGTVIKHDESAGTDTDDIANFTGSFWALQPGTELIKITTDPAGDTDLKFYCNTHKKWTQT